MKQSSKGKQDHSHRPECESVPPRFRLSTYQYQLPDGLVAQEPSTARDGSRLMMLGRDTGEIRHRQFRDLPDLLSPSDLLVINETRVTPAALFGRKPSGGRVELLVLDPIGRSEKFSSERLATRVCLVRSSKPIRAGAGILLDNGPELSADAAISPGRVRIVFPVPENRFLDFLEEYGSPPLPPYIDTSNRNHDRDRSRYQTVYAKIAGSVAAPTAGLHFTDGLMSELSAKGIEIVRILLQVGPGTFTPVRNEDIRLHRMEPEFYEIADHAARSIQKALHDRRRVIAVGTTTVRALESAASAGEIRVGKGETDLFIKPGYCFKVVKGLVTNFHLPGSTLLMLVSALGGIDRVMDAYAEAIQEKYRFYSYGDACLILDNY